MKRFFILSLAAALVLVAVNGCDQNRNPLGDSVADQSTVFRVIPNGESVVSATLYLYCATPSMQTVYVHRATADWSDATITWNSFSAAYDAGNAGSFAANSPGWKTVDVTALVKDWIDSTYDNFGLVLDQDVSVYPRAVFFSSENVMNKPYLQVHYAADAYDSTQVFATASDAVITGMNPDQVLTPDGLLLTGYAAEGFEYQSLLRFNLPVIPPPPPVDTTIVTDTTGSGDTSIVVVPDTTIVVPDTMIIIDTLSPYVDPAGCTQNAQWWAHHSGCGHFSKVDDVSPFLPMWLGDPAGQHSIQVLGSCDASEILQPRRNAGANSSWTHFLSELLAAKLNIARGADDADVAAVIAEADAFVADYEQDSHRRSWQRDNARQVQEWTRTLHLYNEGVIGPGRCFPDTPDVALNENDD